MKTGIRTGTCITLLAAMLAAGSPADAIINGRVVTEQDWFAHAVVGILVVDSKGKTWECTGTMLTHRMVLTAAHCVSDRKSASVVFDFNVDGTRKVAATKFFIHPDYAKAKNGLSTADLALIALPPHDYPTTPVSLDSDLNFTKGQQFTIAGYGNSDTRSRRSAGIMRKAAIAVAGPDLQNKVALAPIGDAWPCQGDSGAPILRKDFHGHYALAGVLGGGYEGPERECTPRSIMTPVHAYAEWITKTLASGG